MTPIRVFTAFAGYDSQCLALDRLSRDYPDRFSCRLVGWSEIDQAAINAHNAIYPDAADLNFGDISLIDWASVPDFDHLIRLYTNGTRTPKPIQAPHPQAHAPRVLPTDGRG